MQKPRMHDQGDNSDAPWAHDGTGSTDVVVRPWVICADITPGNS